MPSYEKDPAPIGARLPDSIAYNDREFEKLRQTVNVLNTEVEALRRLARVNGVTILWQWEDTTDTSTMPPAGYVKGNAVQLASVTQFAFSNIDTYGREVLGGDVLVPGDLVVVSAADYSNSQLFSVVNSPVIFPTGIQVDVAQISGTGGYNPGQDDVIRGVWRPQNILDSTSEVRSS